MTYELHTSRVLNKETLVAKEPAMANTTLTTEQIIARGELEGFTAYQIAKLVNVKLAGANVELVRPQMIYNYSKNGMIAKGKKGDMSVRYTRDEVESFVEKFSSKRIAKGTKVEIKVDEGTECEGQMMIEV